MGHIFRLEPPIPDIHAAARRAVTWRECYGCEIINNPDAAWDEIRWRSIGSTLAHNDRLRSNNIFRLNPDTAKKLEDALVQIPWHNLSLTVARHRLRHFISGGYLMPGSFSSCLFNAVAYLGVEQEPEASGLKLLIHEFWLKGNFPIALNGSKLIVVCR